MWVPLPGRILQRDAAQIGDTATRSSSWTRWPSGPDAHGAPPAAALLDGAGSRSRTRTFADHYLELDYDLSGVLWLAIRQHAGGGIPRSPSGTGWR